MKNIIYLLIIFCSLTACGQQGEEKVTAEPEVPAVATLDKEVLAAEIKTLEDKLLQIQDARKDTTSALAMIEKSELYVQNFPADSLSPYLLFRAGDVARGAENPQKAIALWASVWRNYEDHRIAPGALFAQAFTYDAQLGNKKEAERYYRKFIYLYPDHQLYQQVRELVRSVKKSPDEMVRDFKKEQE